MKKLLLSLVVVFAGCGGGSSTSTAPSQPIQPVVHIFNASIKPNELNLSCVGNYINRIALVDPSVSSEYFFQNNTWGSASIIPTYKWDQCIGSTFADTNTVVAKWTWDMGYDSGTGVKSYPEIIYGFKPGANNPTATFPKLINNAKSMVVKWDIEIDKTDSIGQLLLESWISSTNNITGLKDKNMVAEMGIILSCWGAVNGWCTPVGEKVNIGGYDYIFNVNAAPIPGNPMFITFNSVTPQLGKGGVDIALFLNFIKSRGILNDQQYIDDIEFGTEIAAGKGAVRLNSYSITTN